MDPIYDKQRNRMDVVFRSNDQLMDTVSDISASILEVQESWTESELDQSGKPASREGLMHATLHYFQAASVDEEEIGDLSRDKMPSPRLHRFGFAEDSPIPVFTCLYHQDKILRTHPECGEPLSWS